MIDRLTQEAYEYYYSEERINTEPVVCSVFGCSKNLTAQEKMFGNKCIRHSTKGAIAMKENLYTPDCIRTFSGKYVNLFDPDPETICIEDIAHSLAGLVRWNAQTMERFSVAQHSLIAADLGPDEHRLELLMHDSPEAYLGDMTSPLKRRMPEYKAIEDKFMRVIAAKFGLQYPFDPIVKEIDEEMKRREWYSLVLERGKTFEVYSPQKAKVFFLKQFEKLKSA